MVDDRPFAPAAAGERWRAPAWAHDGGWSERAATSAVARQLAEARAAVRLLVATAVAFPVLVLVDGATRGGGYDAMTHWISLLSLGERGTAARLLVALAGAGLLVGASGLAPLAARGRGPRVGTPTSVRSARAAARWIGVLGGAFLVAAVFTLDPVPTYPAGSARVPMSLSGLLHSLAGCTIVLATGAACWTGRRLVDGSRTWWWGAVGAAAVAVGAVTMSGAVAVLRDGNWELAHAGLCQRVSMFTALGWIAAAGVVALRGARGHRRAAAKMDGWATSAEGAAIPVPVTARTATNMATDMATGAGSSSTGGFAAS